MPKATVPASPTPQLGPLAGRTAASGSAFAPSACARRKPLRLILNLHSDLGERLGVLPTVVSAEKQLPGTGEPNAESEPHSAFREVSSPTYCSVRVVPGRRVCPGVAPPGTRSRRLVCGQTDCGPGAPSQSEEPE